MLVIDRLTKTFRPPRSILRPFIRSAVSEPVTALEEVSLTVTAGEVVGLVGANGAGKTTLIKTIATLLTPTSGTVLVEDYDAVEHPLEARARLGLVLSDDRGLYWRLSGRENLEFFGAIAGLSRSAAAARAEELLLQMDLHRRDKLVFGYSAGMRSRLNVARALMTRPRLLVLDEPTRSLDRAASRSVYATVRRLADDGVACLVASHRLEEVVNVCDRVVVLTEGQVSRVATAAELTADTSAVETLTADIEERP